MVDWPVAVFGQGGRLNLDNLGGIERLELLLLAVVLTDEKWGDQEWGVPELPLTTAGVCGS